MAPMVGRTTVREDIKSITICVDSYEDSLLKGYLYHSTLTGGKRIDNMMQLILTIENILEETGFPKAMTEKRLFGSFAPQESKKEMVSEATGYAAIKGGLATFRLRIMFRQNASWQGSLVWVENNAEETFRSALELLILMDSAMSNKIVG